MSQPDRAWQLSINERGSSMARIKVWKEPVWSGDGFWFAARWTIDDGYRTTGADSWARAMSIARQWAGIQ